MKKYFEILTCCQLFAGVAETELPARLACLAPRVCTLQKNEYILQEGEKAECIGILLSGAAHIEQVDYFGNRSILADIQPGELFGESFAYAEVETLPVDVVADETATVMLIERERLISPCSNACGFHQQLIHNLLRVLAAKNLAFHQKLTVTAGRTTRDKLMLYLYQQAKKAGSGSFTIPFDRQELADYLGVDRSGLSAEISALRRAGVLRSEKNKFILLHSPDDDGIYKD